MQNSSMETCALYPEDLTSIGVFHFLIKFNVSNANLGQFVRFSKCFWLFTVGFSKSCQQFSSWSERIEANFEALSSGDLTLIKKIER